MVTSCKKSHGIPNSPRAAAVAKFRLLTGHDCLCAHLFRFNLVNSPICVLCDTGQDMTAAHLDECSALNDLNCIVKRRTTAQQVANQFLAASGKQISRKTVARRLRGGGLYALRPVVCVPLTRQHRTVRLQWCRDHHNGTEQDWACVLF
ncbi:uncharacterized protein TNCV_895621 [Trichonephila clavipes]|nr:uncharacterized protein TNCV_895621 [Trichonephila clavipes]